MCDADALDQPITREILAIVQSAEFRTAVDALPGYDARYAGRALRLGEAFPSLAEAVAAD